MNGRWFLFPLLVFLGGCCYGPSSPMIKIAYASGFSVIDVVMSQYFYGWLILLILVVTRFFKGFSPRFAFFLPLTMTRVLRVFATGASIALVSICYCFSLQSIPASVSVILLFQFTWVGVIIQALVERRMPSRRMMTAVVILIVGTILAAGLAGSNILLTVDGVAFGMLSALLYALYIFLLGRTESEMHPLTRSFVIMSCSLAFLVCILPHAYIMSGTMFSSIWVYGVILGLFGCALPMFLFSIGTPHISTGIATILSSSELPASIICAVFILSEVVSWVQWVGISLIFFGISYPYLGIENASDRKSMMS
ncbi:MAG: DMT family transporter [Methanocalculaceae archaeon]|jgi:drug/metabolite transporter (DMT)-like permease|nr:DMT family transporter [Methanocalculaceae archaeon]